MDRRTFVSMLVPGQQVQFCGPPPMHNPYRRSAT